MDNVRATREAMARKVTLTDKHPYKTIDPPHRRAHDAPHAHRTLEYSLDKEPTRKKITINDYHIKKDSTGLAGQQRSKLRSTGKWEGGRRASEPKRRSKGGDESHSVENLLSRNLQMIKFSVQRERERLITKQKYKRSEQVRSLMEQRKGSSLGQRRDSTHRLKHQPSVSPHAVFKDVALDELMTEEGDSLEEVFQQACAHYWGYLAEKEGRLGVGGSEAVTGVLKDLRGERGCKLEEALHCLDRVTQEVGELSSKTVAVRGIVLSEQGQHNEAILYLCKAMERTHNDLFQLHLPGRDASSRHLLTLIGYLSLARAYHRTSNYLCAINTLNYCQEFMGSHVPSQQRQVPSQVSQQQQRAKKKSWALGSGGEGQATTSKFKKHSHPYHNHSSIELEQSKKKLSTRLTSTLHQHSLAEVPQAQDTLPILSRPSASSPYSPYLALMHLLLARLYLRTRRWPSAVSSYKQAICHDPLKLEPQLELASLYLARSQPNKALEWLEECLSYREGQEGVETSYMQYHKALVLYEVGRLGESQVALNAISCKELASESCYYRALIGLREVESRGEEAGQSIDEILMLLNGAISAFTSREYLVKAYFQILLILLFHKHDYYGAEYQVNRYRKVMPLGASRSQPSRDLLGLSRVSRMVDEEESSEGGGGGESGNWRSEDYFGLLFRLVEGVICVLKMKMGRGLALLKGVTLELEEEEEMARKYGSFYCRAMAGLLLQFKFYAYYIVRDYELALKHANRLLAHPEARPSPVQRTLMTINKFMLETMILMRQGKYNYAMSKLAEIEALLPTAPPPTSPHAHPQHSLMAHSNYHQLKALCLIQLYAQLEQEKEQDCSKEGKTQPLEEPNKEVLLAGEELLRACLMGEKENSVLYYLIAGIHFELGQWESSLKYIREALEYSDDHMIKHYFAKGNSKLMLGRTQEAIKDYTNAVIVHKEQPVPTAHPDEEYYSEPQHMIPGIYLNRAIAYLKHAYTLAQQPRHYPEHSPLIPNYKLKAAEDLTKYFQSLSSPPTPTPQQLTQRLLLYLHSDDPAQLLEAAKTAEAELSPDHSITVYYLTKELNNCIHAMQAHPAPTPALRVDLLCLQALKKSSSPSQEALQEALMGLLELSEQVYKDKEEELEEAGEREGGCTLEEMFGGACGAIFRWSDVLFFIGVLHFELGEYRTAVKYFEESMNEKKANGSLVSLWGYMSEALGREEDKEEDCLFAELEGLLENRVYCKEEVQYNIGVGYLMMHEYKKAYHYLQDYPNFLLLIKKALHPPAHSKQAWTEEDPSEKEWEGEQEEPSGLDITPFPTHNRLCSIYPPTKVDQFKFHLSFCLPRIALPLLDLFTPGELEPGTLPDETISNISNKTTPRETPLAAGLAQKGPMESVVGHICLEDLEMKPMAPWIRHGSWGVVFTETVVEESVELNSGRKKEEGRDEEKKKKRERYAEEETTK